MTRLFNLESYVECCQYAQLYNESLDDLIPQPGDLPNLYKKLLQKYTAYPYLQPQIFNKNRPQELIINQNKLDYLLAGDELTSGEKQRLLIIRDTVDLMTLSMSDILGNQDSYLYSSAYHYWNHYSEIHQHQISKPLVLMNLDNFNNNILIPVDFTKPENSPAQIPILDTRNPIVLDSTYNCIETYTNICHNLARLILVDNSLPQNHDTISYLSCYLQKHNFFQIIQPEINQEYLDFIIEIFYNNQIFYKQIKLATNKIAKVLFQELNIEYLNQLASNYPQYQFALISQYNIFSDIQKSIPSFMHLNPQTQEFKRFWEAKNQENFPLFAIYLDVIKFAINIDGSQQWIELSNDAISYEGETTVFTGKIASKNQDFFRIPQGIISARLPIQINGEDYCKNNIPQDYNIEVQDNQVTDDISIRIEFYLQPGSFPRLEVRDLDGKYKFKTFLTNRQIISYQYIPIENIILNRQERSISQINRLCNYQRLPDFKLQLQEIANYLNKFKNRNRNYPIDDKNLAVIINDTYRIIDSRLDILLFINTSSNEPIVNELRTQLQTLKLHRLFNILLNSKLNTSSRDCLKNAIILTGKLYQFSQDGFSENIDKFFNQDILGNLHPGLLGEYLQCFARIAVNDDLQSSYFSLFTKYYRLENSQYLWGYGRILLWYYNFDQPAIFLNYREHFRAIIQYLLTKEINKFNYKYKQDAFLSLLYLLSFREKDETFCQAGTYEMQISQRLINHFREDRIILIQVSREKPLNQLFEEMILGSLTVSGINDLIQA